MRVDPSLQHQDSLRLLEEVREFMSNWHHPAMAPWIAKIDAHLNDPAARVVQSFQATVRAGRFWPNGVGYSATMSRGMIHVNVDTSFWDAPVSSDFTLGQYVVHHLQLPEGLGMTFSNVEVRYKLVDEQLLPDLK